MPPPRLFRLCDIVLEDGDTLVVLANKEGRNALEALCPETPLDWIPRSLRVLPIEWQSSSLSPSIICKFEPPSLVGFSIALLRAGSRVVIIHGDSYKLLRDELDIQQIRPQ